MALPYPAMDFTPFDILTAAEMDQLVANDQALANGTAYEAGWIPNSALAGGITQDKLATTAGNGPLKSKIIFITRDASAASGDVSYTGTGFIPSSLIANAHVDATLYYSNGFSDSTRTAISTFHNGSTAYWDNPTLITYSNQSSWGQSASVKSYDADGFTLTWGKVGTPTAGTIKIAIICYR